MARRTADALPPTTTLPDYLRPGLRAVSIGINPSLYSVEAGFAFARPGNRFWPALLASGLAPAHLVPSREAIEWLHRHAGIGFTDIVKRPSRNAAELSRDDFREGAAQLAAKLARHAPDVAWFQGKEAWRRYREYALGLDAKAPLAYGLQAEKAGSCRVFVTPNPSGANPDAAPALLRDHFAALAGLLQGKSRPK